MSYDEYGHHTGLLTAASATRSPHRSASSRRTPETVSSSAYARSSSPLSTSARGSPVARKARYSSVSGSRSTDNSPLHLVDSQQQQQDHGAGCVGSSFVPVNRYNSSSHFSRGAAAIDDFSSTMMDPMDRRNPGGGGGSGPGGLVGSSGSSAMMANSGSHHRSRSATRASGSGMNRSYHSLDRDGHDREREFIPIREGRDLRDCSTERGMESLSRRDRSMDRSMMVEDELMYRESGGGGGGGLSAGLSRSSRQSPAVDLGLKALGGGGSGGGSRESYLMELQSQNTELSRELGQLKKELELTNQKLGSSMHSIKTFWSPELKKERALRKEESAKYSLINDQLKLLNSENQKQAMLVRQLEEELRIRSMQNPGLEVRQQMEALYAENEHLGREVAILRDTCKELELRIDTQKQTLQSRDESIKKLLEMLQTKGMGKDEERLMLHQMQTLAQKQLDELRTEITRRDQELLATGAKMKTLEEQHHDYQRHIAVLKESLCAKEEHYNMIQADVEELRQRLEEKNRLIEKKTQAALQATQERNRLSVELNEVRENADIKDRKINVLQRKLELQEATNGGAKAEETAALRRQIEEQRKQLEELRKANDQRSKQFQERERSLQNLEKQLQKRKESFDVLEAKLQQANNSPANAKGGDNQATNELRHILAEKEKELAQSKAEGQKAQNEMERLLQLVQMSQEEQFAKDKTIMELQEALRKRPMHNSPSPAPDRSNEAQNRTQVEQLTREKEELQATVIQYQKEIREYCDKITALQQALREKAQSFERLESKSADYDALIRQMEEKNRRLAEFEHMKEQLKAKEGQVRDLEACLKLVEETEQQLKDRLQKVEEMEQNLLVQSEQQTSERVQHLEAEVEKLKSENEAKEKGLDEVKAELRQRESVVEDLQYSLSKERLTVEELHTDVKFLQNTLDEFRQEFKTQKEELSNLQKKAKLLESELQHKDSSIDELLHSVTLKDKRIEELEGDIRMKEKTIDDLSLDLDSKEDNKEYGEENKTKEDTKVNESLQAVVVSQLQDRIEELEEALRESVCITADREVTLDREMSQRIKLEEKVGRLEQRLQSLQNAQSLKCPSCRPIKLQLQQLESKLAKLCAERRSHLHELFDMKQEALEAAISERDAQLALLEVSGIKTAKAAEQADSLRGDRKRLMDLMREQNEKRVKLLQEFEEPALIWRPSSGHEMDFEDDSNDNSGDRLASNSDPNNHPPLVDNR